MRFDIGHNDVRGFFTCEEEHAYALHSQTVELNQCGSILMQQIHAPIEVVWSIVRSFGSPQIYKKFIQACILTVGDGGVGSIREVFLVSGVPATSSIERLEILDDEKHVFSFRVLKGGHRLQNYRSVTTLHEQESGGPCKGLRNNCQPPPCKGLDLSCWGYGLCVHQRCSARLLAVFFFFFFPTSFAARSLTTLAFSCLRSITLQRLAHGTAATATVTFLKTLLACSQRPKPVLPAFGQLFRLPL
ncbi:uncharacterized protein [Physcomitrium patens]|uniref:Bet v I/Major latex protein domain-containing protein n=1 Tax=Physcomitrium patens TaxID=3218 RepID=A0A2K1K3W2_PHYPA|nr:uncharacterized protein LOC112287042 isoform X1 [Physcomitrium patens]PNR48465.1 hypothetical protein PHYPA_012941 [Physcomitrium patens]|eukprot:XP_024385413.1 uncharacterized protein LOC112287042 isoform X1 [Physcomitrella patens]